MKRILIIGATSAIAEACAREWLQQDDACQFVLTGRDRNKLDMIKADLQTRGAQKVDTLLLDINDLESHATIIQEAGCFLGQLDRVLVAPGALPDQALCQQDLVYARESINTNATSIMMLLEQLATTLEHQRTGHLVVISSVAGDRGRMSNYFYGAAKAAVTVFCSGLMMRLQKSGVSVSVIKPGFVQTPMTADLNLPDKLVATPEQVARVIVKGSERQQGVIYAPGFWLFIMAIIRLIPTAIFKRLSL
jgi:short-subunit dehydrogenase|tara:strand:+ start:3948 stop:4694 length:747 start_codon:yes stop_codon:yes gene_type:complete